MISIAVGLLLVTVAVLLILHRIHTVKADRAHEIMLQSRRAEQTLQLHAHQLDEVTDKGFKEIMEKYD